jgi:pSer/pThr/pTyr-binding forkhead associated (FHA) protein
MEAYAKLVDRNSLENDAELEKREFLITELPCSVGRVYIESSDFFCIVIDSTDVLLSRQHAQIRWSLEDGWTLTCLSKNGLFVDERKYRKDEQASLRDGSDIRLGNATTVFFILSALHFRTDKHPHISIDQAMRSSYSFYPE